MTNEELFAFLQEFKQEVNQRLDESDARQRDTDLDNQRRFGTLEQDIAWIRGRLEGAEKTETDARARRATWIAAISVVIALASFTKGFFA